MIHSHTTFCTCEFCTAGPMSKSRQKRVEVLDKDLQEGVGNPWPIESLEEGGGQAMKHMDYNEFFKQHGDCIIYGHEDMVSFTTEELYQAIKARLKVEWEFAQWGSKFCQPNSR